jgi:hypothetical protein
MIFHIHNNCELSKKIKIKTEANIYLIQGTVFFYGKRTGTQSNNSPRHAYCRKRFKEL